MRLLQRSVIFTNNRSNLDSIPSKKTSLSLSLSLSLYFSSPALFLYVFVTLIGLYKLFQLKLKEGTDRSDEFNKTMCL